MPLTNDIEFLLLSMFLLFSFDRANICGDPMYFSLPLVLYLSDHAFIAEVFCDFTFFVVFVVLDDLLMNFLFLHYEAGIFMYLLGYPDRIEHHQLRHVFNQVFYVVALFENWISIQNYF